MRASKTLAKFRNNDSARVCALGHFIPSYICHAAHYGFDCIWLDLEHRNMHDREVQALMALFHLYDIDCMLRPPTLEKSRLYRYLEDGATGLMIPHVSTPEKAQSLVDAVKFPPVGDRGQDGAGLDSEFYLGYSEEYTQQANDETFLVVQIETLQAVENVDAIAAIPGVDAMFVGPGDLGLRIKHSNGELTLEAAFDKVAAAAKKHGKAWGCPAGTVEDMQKRHDQGARLLAHGGEFMALKSMLEQCSADFDSVAESRT
jgi:2-keto-3-deoxy-L-rhamnonate aldolase RhmA